MVIKAGGKKFDLPKGGLLRWATKTDGSRIAFHIEVEADGALRVYFPSQELPEDIEYGAHEICKHCGK